MPPIFIDLTLFFSFFLYYLNNNSTFALKKVKNMAAFNLKTKEEYIAAFKRAVERKRKFEEDARREFEEMQKNQINVVIS